MSMKEFLEVFPLFKPYTFDQGERDFKLPSTLNAKCTTCNSDQTFQNQQKASISLAGHNGNVYKTRYRCAACTTDSLEFMILVKDQSIRKVGQFPLWSIEIDPVLRRALGKHLGIYKKGLVCESQSYGIGAFAYYRRIVELIIDQLLNDIGEMISDTESHEYEAALAKLKNTQMAKDKIALVKDILPPVL